MLEIDNAFLLLTGVLLFLLDGGGVWNRFVVLAWILLRNLPVGGVWRTVARGPLFWEGCLLGGGVWKRLLGGTTCWFLEGGGVNKTLSFFLCGQYLLGGGECRMAYGWAWGRLAH